MASPPLPASSLPVVAGVTRSHSTPFLAELSIAFTQQKIMNAQKNNYATPTLTVYGNVENLTQQGGASSTDVPLGTPVGPDGISSVAS